jgi:hypothetical protein
MQARLFDVRMGTAANKRRVLILWTTGATAYTPTEQPLVKATPASEYFRIAWPSRAFDHASAQAERGSSAYRRNKLWALVRAIFKRSDSLMEAWSNHCLAATTSS